METSKKFFGVLTLIIPFLITVWTQVGTSFVLEGKTLISQSVISTAENDAREALRDTLYYRFEPWVRVFQEKIAELDRSKHSVENQLEQMKYYFFLAGLHVELSHMLGFTSQYKISQVEEACFSNIRHAKGIAQKILDSPGISENQKAQAYLYLGAAEGYLGIFEYGAGHLIQALLNGFQADNHLEEALALDPSRYDAYLGLGIYRYGNSRLGGVANFIMQGGKDMRKVGIDHIERAVQMDDVSTPLALKTLVWFYISEQINPENSNLSSDHPLSKDSARNRARNLIEIIESRYFLNPPSGNFFGNKELAMMKALQFILDEEYAHGKKEFEKSLKIIARLRSKGFAVNPQQEKSIRAGIRFSENMMFRTTSTQRAAIISACSNIIDQIAFMDRGGTILEYDSEQVRNEIDSIFYQRLVTLSHKLGC